MKKGRIMNKMFNKVAFQLKKHSPEILIMAGVVGVVTSAVMACKATTELPDVLHNAKEDIDSIHTLAEDETTDGNANKELIKVYTRTGIKLTKLYAPSIGIGVLSISSILASNNILQKRNVALAAAYTTIDKGFKEYRNRVVEQYGKKVDHKLRYNIKAKEFEETLTNENGKETTVKNTVDIVDPNTYGDYAKFFDETALDWTRDSEKNLMFLRCQQQYANDLLVSRGHLFLNEVYDMLGIKRTKAGQIVGWVYNKKNPVGDNFVDFGIYNVNREKNRDFVNGYENAILLDFNVDGPILELMRDMESI